MTALMTLVTRTTGSESVPLGKAYGRRLAADVTAPINVPQQTNAAMDGVALAWSDTRDTRWPVAGEAFAGQAFSGLVPAGQCVRITTGAPLPEGTDTVIMREQLDEQPEHVTINAPDRIKRGQHIRQAGEDIRAGSVGRRHPARRRGHGPDRIIGLRRGKRYRPPQGRDLLHR